jgi:hypothetical protein
VLASLRSTQKTRGKAERRCDALSRCIHRPRLGSVAGRESRLVQTPVRGSRPPGPCRLRSLTLRSSCAPTVDGEAGRRGLPSGGLVRGPRLPGPLRLRVVTTGRRDALGESCRSLRRDQQRTTKRPVDPGRVWVRGWLLSLRTVTRAGYGVSRPPPGESPPPWPLHDWCSRMPWHVGRESHGRSRGWAVALAAVGGRGAVLTQMSPPR